jgi:gliding motility-associated-like protein
MRGTLTKLLTVTSLLVSMLSPQAAGQCALITDNYSGQVAGSVCAPVNLNMDVRYKFILPVDPSLVQILYVWNDGTGATTLMPADSQGDTIFTATASHLFPPANNHCSYTAEAYVVYDGQQCVSSSRQEQTFSAWARDNQNGAVIITEPVVAQFCEGEDIIDVIFRDNSTFNCNVNIEPDKPNRITRWVQFIYGTTTIGGDRIPNVTIRDPLGNIYPMTDAVGNSLPAIPGPIVEIPIPADGPTEISWPISAPAGAIAGDIFEITMRNWNICNPYDRNPFDAIPPTNPIDGDNPPITTTALIEIITTPPVITNPSLEFCAGSPINLNLSTSGGQVNWYTDSLLTNHIHTGSSFDPTGAPTFIDNSVSGTHSFWVTETIGACASSPSRVSFRIFDTPAPVPHAGNDEAVCNDRYILDGNTPVIGIGNWTTTSSADISDPADPHSQVTNLIPGPNLFRWTMTNGPCVSVDEVIITRDLQPDPAEAGNDQSFCDITSAHLNADAPTDEGTGTWTVVSGSGSFNNRNNPTAIVSTLSGGVNVLVWTVRSRYGVCTTTRDTLDILRDRTPDPANAGPDRGACDSSEVQLAALPVTHNGTGTWSVINGTGIFSDTHIADSDVSNLSFGSNRFRWTIASQYGICAGSSDDVLISRDERPASALAGDDQFLCNSTTSPLGANIPTVGAGSWAVTENPSGTPPSFNPSVTDNNATVTINPGNEGIYSFAWTIINGSCITSDTLSVDFGLPVPPADAGIPDSVCGTEVTLNGNSAGIGTGTWTKISGIGNAGFIPGSHAPVAIARIDYGSEGYYEFEWRIRSGSCPPTADTVGILFKPMPDDPSANDEQRCGPGSVTIVSSIGAGGDINRWYTSSSGGMPVFEGNNFTTPVLNSDTEYWVASFNYVTGCESYRFEVNALINEVPDNPVTSDIQHCGNSTFEITAVTGNNGNINRWYDNAIGGNLILEADTFSTPLLSSPLTYWVSSYNSITGCESNRSPLHVQVDPVPGIPAAGDTSRCGEGSVTFNSSPGIDGNRNQWFDALSGGTLLDTTLNLVTPYLTSSTPYWVSTLNTHTGCVSPRIRVNANIHAVPDFPGAADVIQCGPDTVTLISVPGTNGTIVRWYDSLTGGNLLSQGNEYVSGFLTTTSRYYVSSYNESTHCESSRREIKAIILPVPSPVSIIGPDAVGIGQTNVIYSVNFHSGSTYFWTIPPGINIIQVSQNFVLLEFPTIGLYNISVIETNSLGCQGPPSNKPIEVKADLIVLNIHPLSGNGCTNTPLELSVTPTGGTPSYTFEWTGDIQYLSSVNISDPVFTAPLAGNYSLIIKVTDINLNETSDTINITVFPNPSATIISDSIVCAGYNLLMNAGITGGSGVYDIISWTGQTSPLSATGIVNPIFSTYITGYYKMFFTVEDNNGCAAIDSITVWNDSPQAAFTSDAIPACSPVEVKFTNLSVNAIDYAWDFDDGNTSAQTDPQHIFNNTSTSVQYFNVKLTAISQYGCAHSSNGYVTVYPNPELEISTYPEKACAPADILLSSTPGGVSYFWDFGDGSNSFGDFNIMHTFENETDHDTVFLVTIISTSFFGCEDTGYSAITVHPSPEALFVADPHSQMIPERTVNLDNTTEDGNWTYFWRFGDDSTSVLREPVSHTFPGPGNYLIYLIVRGEHCADSIWASAEILPHPPIAAFKPVEPGCMPLTIQFENTSAYSNSFLWEFGDGAVSNKPNPEYTYYEPGTFSIKLTAWGDNGTADSYTTDNDVYVLPNAFFDIKPRRVFVNDQNVLFENQSDNGSWPVDDNTYLWDFGDGTGSDDVSPHHMYKKAGNYNVTLNVWTDKGCYDVYEYTAAVLVDPIGKIIFPNVFSPEAVLDENKIFKPGIIDYVEDYHLMIFNRWGELIFESFDQELGWDGRISNKPAKEDVYIWKVEGKYTNGQTFVLTGDVTLLH